MTTTTVRAAYGNATFSAALNHEEVASILRSLDEMAKREGLSRASARQWVINALRRNEHLTKEGGQHMAGTLLWLACRSDAAALAEDAARQGGITLAYEITGKAPNWNFRLMIYPSDDRPEAPVLPGLPGGSPLKH